METSLYAPKKMVEIAVKYVSFFIIDIKILEENIVKNVLKGNINNYYQNINYLFNKVKKDNIILRIPVTKEYTLSENNVNNLINFLKNYIPSKVELFKIHELGEKKYKVLNRKLTHFQNVSDDELTDLKEKIEQINIKCEICRI